MRSWVLLFLSGLVETAWAIGMKQSHGFTRPLPTVLTVLGMIVSMVMLAIASRDLPISTAYAVWVGIGAVGTTILGIALLGEPAGAPRLMFLALLVIGIVGLKVTTPTSP